MPLTDDQTAALSVARELARHGVPLFLARPNPHSVTKTGYDFPSGWQRTAPDPSGAVVDAWVPGLALCALMGHGLDLIDFDPRNGGDPALLNGTCPRILGVATTPSGGFHAFIRSIGEQSRDNLLPGIDYKGGRDGKGHGLAFLAPTRRLSKVTGEMNGYAWYQAPDPESLAAEDNSGAALADMVRKAHRGQAGSAGPGEFMRVGPWQDVAGTLARGRDVGVFELAASLRGQGGWQFDQALEYMRSQVWPLIDQSQGGHEFSEIEFEKCARSAFERYPDGAQQRMAEAADTASEQIPLHGVGLSDAWMVKRVAAHLMDRFLWTKGLGWLCWDGRRWSEISDVAVKDHVRQYCIFLHSSASAAGIDAESLKRLAALLKSGAYGTYTNDARGVDGIYHDASDFDRHPDLLNCANGVIDLRTGELQPHDPALRMTKLTPVEYHPEATHPDWTAALQALPPDIHDWYQTSMGQAATGYMSPDDRMIVQQGGGENGKGTIAIGITRALGDYFLMVSHRALLATSDAHPTELCDFRGARYALLEETPETARLSVTRLKMLVGTPQITARKIRQDSITFDATHTLILSTNYRPNVDETDHGTWRRLALVTYPFTFTKPGVALKGPHARTGDPGLRDRIERGRDGQHTAVLAWLVAGAMRWYGADQVMPTLPERIVVDTREWRKEADLILAYLDERVEFEPARHVTAVDLSADFSEWLQSRGQRAWSEKTLSARLSQHSEISAHGVTKGVVRRDGPTGAALSRRPARPGQWGAQTVVGATYKAWLGLRFEGEDGSGPNLVSLAPKPSPINPNGLVQTSETQGSDQDQTMVTRDVTGVTAPRVKQQNENIAIEPLTGTAVTPVTDPQPKIITDDLVPDTVGDGLPVVVARGWPGWEAGPQMPVSEDDAAGVVRHLIATTGALTVDVETSGYPVGHPDYRLRTVQLGTAETGVRFLHPEHAPIVRALFAEAPIVRAFVASADLVPLVHAGLADMAIWERTEDVAVMAALAELGAANDALGLKDLSKTVLKDSAVSPAADKARGELFKARKWLTKTEAITPVARSGWAQVNRADETMIRYAVSDVLDTAALADAITRPDADVFARECQFQRITSRVTHTGLRIDSEYTAQRHALSVDGKATAAELIKPFGITNPGSDAQVAKVLTDMGAKLGRTKPSKTHPDGRPSVAKDTMAKLRNHPGPWSELVDLVLDYRHHATALSLLLTPWKLLVDRGDGRARPTIYTLGTNTGRTSCVRPNLQQASRAGGIRPCLTADEGSLIVSADFSGVELRVAAVLSGDENLRRMLLEGVDIHGEIAKVVHGPEASKADRYNTKRLVFGHIYGGGVEVLAANQGVSESEAGAAIDVLRDMAPGLARWSEGVKRAVRDGHTQFPTYAGRVIHLPKAFPHKAPNYCIQGTARELLVDALIRWDDGPYGGGVILPIHDEIVAVVSADQAPQALEYLTQCMATELYGVPIVASAGTPAFAWPDAE